VSKTLKGRKKTMTDKFVVTTPAINRVIDGVGPDFSLMSVEPSYGGAVIELVVGAHWSKRTSCSFSRGGVKELIDILRDIHAAMED
jgi:hypothetical protein